MLLEIFSSEVACFDSKASKWQRFVECMLDTMRYHSANLEVLCKGTAVLAALTDVASDGMTSNENLEPVPVSVRVKGGCTMSYLKGGGGSRGVSKRRPFKTSAICNAAAEGAISMQQRLMKSRKRKQKKAAELSRVLGDLSSFTLQ